MEFESWFHVCESKILRNHDFQKILTECPNFKVHRSKESKKITLGTNNLTALSEVVFLCADTVTHRYINWIIILNVTVGETTTTQSNDLSKADIGQRCRVILVQQIQNWKNQHHDDVGTHAGKKNPEETMRG